MPVATRRRAENMFTGGERSVTKIEKEKRRKHCGGEVTGDARCIAAAEKIESKMQKSKGEKKRGRAYRGDGAWRTMRRRQSARGAHDAAVAFGYGGGNGVRGAVRRWR